MTTLERFDKWKNPTRPADNKIRVWQHQTSFFIIVQSNKIQCHVYQITWYKVEQQLYNRMISQFSIYTLILGIFDWNPLHIIRNNRPSSGYKHWQRDLSYNQFSPTLPDGRCLNLHKLFDESLYSLQAVGRMCVVWRHFEFQYWQELLQVQVNWNTSLFSTNEYIGFVFFKDEGLNGIRPTNKTVSHCQTFFLNYLISMTISYACYIISSFYNVTIFRYCKIFL